MALGITDHVWSVGELLDAALAVAPPAPTETAPDRWGRFRVIEGARVGVTYATMNRIIAQGLVFSILSRVG
jgi:hypothetical protein